MTIPNYWYVQLLNLEEMAGADARKYLESWGSNKNLWGFSNNNGLSNKNIEIYPNLPSGKHWKNYGKSPFSMGKSTINHHFL